MKLACPCGNVISDITDDLPMKAYVVPDQRYEEVWDAVEAALNASPPLSETESDRLWGRVFHPRNFRPAYQCEECGRVLIENRKGRMVSFLPENARAARGVFRGH